MALSGSFTGTTANQYIQPKITWSATQNTDENYSTVTAKLTYSRTNSGYQTYGTWKGSITINGTTSSASKSITITQNSNTLAISATVKVPHNSDGTKSITISASGSIANTSLTSTSISGTVTLDQIPRASSITSASAVTLGNACSVKWTPLASSFAYKLKFVCGSVSYTTGYISPASTSAYTYTGYTMTVATWAKAMPSSYSGTCTVTLYTYTSSSSSTAIGSDSATFTLTLSSSVKPTVTFADPTLVSGWNGYYIQGKSKCTLSATFAAGTGSTIKSCSISGTGLSISGTSTSLSGTTSVLTGSGTITYTAKVTDGRTSVTATKSIYVYPYAVPSISLTAARTSTSGSVKITYKASCSPVNSKNSLVTLKIYSKLSTASTWPSSAAKTISLSSTSVSSSVTLTGFESTSSYDFKGVITDTYGSSNTSSIVSVASEFRILNIRSNKKGLSIGKMSEENAFECNLTAKFLQDIYSKDDAIITSDRKAKTSITDMAHTQEQLFNKLRPVTYKFKNGTSGRIHYGFISQDIEDALSDLKLTGQDFAGFCKDLRVDSNGDVKLDENGNEIYDYALRYSEFIALNTYMIQKLQAENIELRAELQELKEMITSSSNNVE